MRKALSSLQGIIVMAPGLCDTDTLTGLIIYYRTGYNAISNNIL